jgi:hypothetical protein
MSSMRIGPPGGSSPVKPVRHQSAAERRRSIRYSHLTKGTLLAECAGPAAQGQEVAVFNVSNHGVGFRCEAQLEFNSIHRIRIGSGPLHLSSFIKIVHCRPAEDGMTDYGAEFC